MNIILLSGGSGQRLWPLSNEIRSKQFLKMIKTPDGKYESMAQRVHRQIIESGISANILVATGSEQSDIIREQIGYEVDLVVEPERRNTFPAILLSCEYLAYKKGIHPGETLIVLPVDSYTDLEYFQTLKKMERLIEDDSAKIVLMGIKPTYPSAHYGYIIPGPDGITVDTFHEKPTTEYAEELISAGARWNGGVFAFRLGYMLELAKKYIRLDTYEDLESQYKNLPKVSFDYEVVENESSIAMIEYSGTWRDIGTWGNLVEVLEDNNCGKAVLANNCMNTHVINTVDIPIMVLGTKDLVVVASPDGILVSDKNESSHLKSYIDAIDQESTNFEMNREDSKVLNYSKFSDGMMALTRIILFKAKETTPYQSHNNRDEILNVVDGTGELVLGGRINYLRRGDVAHIGKGKCHAIRATSDLRIIEVQIGIELSESDVEQSEWEWQ